MNVSMTVRRKFGMQAKEMEQEMDAALIEVEYQLSVDSCKDHDVSFYIYMAVRKTGSVTADAARLQAV